MGEVDLEAGLEAMETLAERARLNFLAEEREARLVFSLLSASSTILSMISVYFVNSPRGGSQKISA